MKNGRTLVAGALVGLHAGILSLWVSPLGCGKAAITPEEAAADLNDACAILARSLARGDAAIAAAAVEEVCHSAETKALLERAIERLEYDQADAGADFVVETNFPDGGSR